MMTDHEIDLFVHAFLSPPPIGFTEREKSDILRWLKGDLFITAAENRIPLTNSPKYVRLFTEDQ